MLCGIACEPEPSDLEEDETPACKLAAQALDALALNIPSQHVFPTVLAFATAAASSGAANERLAAMRCLSVSAEGCADPMRRKLRSILPHVLRCLQDPTREVRRLLRPVCRLSRMASAQLAALDVDILLSTVAR